VISGCDAKSDWNGNLCPGLKYGTIKFASLAWDARKVMNIPVVLKSSTMENQINMFWEWGWLQDGSPADTRLQSYFGLAKYQESLEI
jgi:hypothetical protein